LKTFEDYLTHVRRSSENTVKAYMKDIKRFFDYLGKSPKQVERADVERFIKALSKGEITGEVVAESTVSRYISSLRTFLITLNSLVLLRKTLWRESVIHD